MTRPIELAKVPLDRKALILRHDLFGEPSPPSWSTQVLMRAGRDQMAVQDRLYDVLEPGALPHDLVAASDLPAQRLGWLVRDPNLRQKAAGVELREHTGVDRVGLDLGMSDDAYLLRVGDHHLLHMRRQGRCDGSGVARRLNHDNVVLPEPPGEGSEQLAPHVDASKPPDLAVLPGHRLGKGAVDVQSDDAHASPPFELGSSKRELAGNTTPTDPRSRRIRASRKGRPCNELGLSAQGLLPACPHLRAPGAPRPGWAHHKAAPWREQPDAKGTAGIMPDNGIVERFHKTVLHEFYRVAFRKKIYASIAELQGDLDAWITSYNEDRPHQGRWCFGKTPMQTFLDAKGKTDRRLSTSDR